MTEEYYWVQIIVKDSDGRLEIDEDKRFDNLKDATAYRQELINKDIIGYAYDYYLYIGDKEGEYIKDVNIMR